MVQAEPEVRRGYQKSRRYRELMRQRQRGDTERIIRRSDALPAWERELVELHLREGIPLTALARAKGHSVGWLRRRLQAIKRRLRDPKFLAASQRRQALPDPLRRVSTAYYLEQRSLRDCAERLGMTVYAVRQALVSARTILMFTRGAAEEPEA
jgi:DNA-directed RNA polymerase specialized sigma24 family protein